MPTIQDFGEKIGGAKKDLWRNRNMMVSDLDGMNDSEKEKFVQKSLVWKKPNYQALVDSGVDRTAVYFMKKVYDVMPNKPMFYVNKPINGKSPHEIYIDFVSAIRDKVEAVRSPQDVKDAYTRCMKDTGFVEKIGPRRVRAAEGLDDYITSKLLTALQTPWTELEREAQDKRFCDSEKKKTPRKPTNRRKSFTQAVMAEVKRDGPEIRGRDSRGQDYLDTFQFRGGEFGNWLSNKERQAALNNNFDAFFDLQQTLKIHPQDISFGGKLAIAFGSRGQKGAAAHYESSREVINLTKLNGDGTLGHEWCHAFDDQLGKKFGFRTLLSKRPTYEIQKFAPAFAKLIDTLQRKEITVDSASRNERITQATDTVKLWLNIVIPDTRLTEEQKATKAQLTERFISEANHAHTMNFDYVMKNPQPKGNPTLDAIKVFAKNTIGRTLNPNELSILASYQDKIQDAIQVQLKTQFVETEFYKESKSFDAQFAKTTNGYWASASEMLARAFACYLTDKTPYRSDYLNGMSEQGPIPRGEEREMINAAIDDMLKEAKELGILHEATPDMLLTTWSAKGVLPTTKSIPENVQITEDSLQQTSLNDLIAAAGEPTANKGPSQIKNREDR